MSIKPRVVTTIGLLLMTCPISWASPTENLAKQFISSKKTVRSAAIQKIKTLDNKTKIQLSLELANHLNSEDETMRNKVIDTLIKIGPMAIPSLTLALQKEDWRDQRWIIASIGEMGNQAKDAIPVLILFLNDENDAGHEAAETLGSMGAVTIHELIKALQKNNPSNRRWLTYALWKASYYDKMAPPILISELPHLIKFLHHKDATLRDTAAKVISCTGPEAKAAVPLLIQLLKDKDIGVRLSAEGALEKIRTPKALNALKKYKRL